MPVAGDYQDMPARLIESLATTGPLSELFSDASVLQAMLDFEAGLARTLGELNVIPRSAASAIASAATLDGLELSELAEDTLRAGTPGIPVAKMLREKVHAIDPDAAGFVHWGATSQDAADTGMVLLLKRARGLLNADLQALKDALRRLSEGHQNTVMLSRTLLQAAPPTTFGLKAAGWLGAVHRAGTDLELAFEHALVLQLGGASGTLASLGEQGIAVGRRLAEELGLAYPDAPWHSQRDRLGKLVAACGVLTAVLGKMARDISLMMQTEVAEAAEPADSKRGGSSTMPHKRNPIGCAVTLAAAGRAPGLVSSFLSAMVQEHERALGGWQSEWPILSAVVQSTGVGLASMAEVAEHLTVDPQRMRANIESTNGAVFAERAMVLLAPKLGRDLAHKIVSDALKVSGSKGQHLAYVLAEMPAVANCLDRETLFDLESPEHYLGVAEEFRKSLVSESRGDDEER